MSEAYRIWRKTNIHFPILLCVLAFLMERATWAQTTGSNLIHVDASGPVVAPQPSDFQPGASVSPSGQVIGLNSRYLTLNGEPWLPVMGEFHYSRYPADRWEEEILKMKAGGVQIVATYVFWIHQEEVEGKFDWSGQRDLRRFVELCAKHGMYVYPRIGPWAHGEARNGGFPDWLIAKVKSPRSNDQEYLRYVTRYYGQIAHQLEGLLWKDGGPVIGIQLENEYSSRGPEMGSEHILELKRLAIQSGLDVPLYTITGWDNAAVPATGVLPVFGGYPDAPWDGSRDQLPPNEVYSFRLGSRVSGDMGAMGAKPDVSATTGNEGRFPFLTVEIGGGIQDTYHRRPVITADDIAAMCPVMLGSGVNLYGLYMFQGGENPDGQLSTLQESQATHYPNDVPVKSYDFQAPLGEFGEERESFRKLKLISYFLNDFGSYLAPMTVHAPAVLPKDPSDTTVVRVSARSSGNHGFIFLNNYLRNYPMPERKAFQIAIKLPDKTMQIPRSPIDVPSGAYFIWPFNLDLGGETLEYSTAQLFTRLDLANSSTYLFFATPGITPEFAFDTRSLAEIETDAGRITRSGDTTYVSIATLAFEKPIAIQTKSGKTIRIFVVSQELAENIWKATIDGTPHLLITSDQFFSDSTHVYLQALDRPDFHFGVFPLVQGLDGSSTVHLTGHSGDVSTFEATVRSRNIPLYVHEIQKASSIPPVAYGPPVPWRAKSVAQAPEDSAFDRAAIWKLSLPADVMDGLSELILRIDYVGDVARLTSRETLLDDNFYNGLPWSVGLSRFLEKNASTTFSLSILPLRKDAPIYLEKQFRPSFGSSQQMNQLKDIKLLPQYKLVLNTDLKRAN